MATVDFCTFVYSGDAHRLYAPGQFKRQVMSNEYKFDNLIVVHQKCQPGNYPPLEDLGMAIIKPMIIGDNHINKILKSYGIDLSRPQYESSTDSHHAWKNHVVNHLCGASVSEADYIVFADNDCWIKDQLCFHNKELHSWVTVAQHILEDVKDCFIVSPNDGEPERQTLRMSQQMFMVRREDFINADFNQPGFSGNVRDYDTMPQYHSMLEGRMEYYCRSVNKFRWVMDSDYRYWHFNRTNEQDLLELDYSKY
jgi:hypothetical protein